MSAIMLALGYEFAVMCGDTKFCYDNGDIGKISKVKMVQDKYLIGFTGRNDSAVDFFSNELDLSLELSKSMKKKTFLEIIEMLDEKFAYYEENGVAKDFDTCVILCGPIHGRLKGIRYLIRHEEIEKKVVVDLSRKLKLIDCFDSRHWNNFKLSNMKEDVVASIMNGFQDMLDKGVEFDESINNEMEAYFINRGKIKPYITQKIK